MDDDTSPHKTASSPDGPSPDPDFEALSDGSDSDFQVPAVFDSREILDELGLATKKPKTSLLPSQKQASPVYEPPSITSENVIPAGQLTRRQNVYRSQTPIEIRERRTAMM